MGLPSPSPSKAGIPGALLGVGGRVVAGASSAA
jgi:hypothetical protein